MIGHKSIRKFLFSLPNIGRGIGAMAFNAVLFFILNKTGDHELLYNYSWILVLTSLFVTFTGWGLRDYFVKEYIKNTPDSPTLFSEIVSGKAVLLGLSALLICFTGWTWTFKIFLIALVAVRTLLAVYDPLILLKGKTLHLFIFESFLYTSTIILFVFFLPLRGMAVQALLLCEAFRALAAILLVRDTGLVRVSLRSALRLLYETKFYFAIALFSLFMSRGDVYIMGTYHKNSFAYYSIILNLVSVSQIIISSVYNNTIKAVFRLASNKAQAALDKLMLQFIILSVLSVSCIIGFAIFIYHIPLDYSFSGLLLVSMFFYCITVKQLFILNHLNKLNYFLIAAILAALVNVVFSILLVPSYQMHGAMVANVSGTIALVTTIKFLLVRNKAILA
ncbi:MAG: polysaccharide biosynthesis C-terminal domain-containing protein [Bacteroidetes bacterium]|nr:polysaccharide biosynthesis C-terminal domain-containing protein [Bacteroidota bacterium]